MASRWDFDTPRAATLRMKWHSTGGVEGGADDAFYNIGAARIGAQTRTSQERFAVAPAI